MNTAHFLSIYLDYLAKLVYEFSSNPLKHHRCAAHSPPRKCANTAKWGW